MSSSFERLKRIADIQEDAKRQFRNRETPVDKPYQAIELEFLTKDIEAAFGPTLEYMQGMDEFA